VERFFNQFIQTLAKKEPKLVFDGILIPLLIECKDNFGLPQRELIEDTLKNSIPDFINPFMLQTLNNNNVKWNEDVIILFRGLLTYQKIDIPQEVIESLILTLLRVVDQFTSDTKYSSLLMNLITTKKEQITPFKEVLKSILSKCKGSIATKALKMISE